MGDEKSEEIDENIDDSGDDYKPGRIANIGRSWLLDTKKTRK